MAFSVVQITTSNSAKIAMRQ